MGLFLRIMVLLAVYRAVSGSPVPAELSDIKSPGPVHYLSSSDLSINSDQIHGASKVVQKESTVAERNLDDPKIIPIVVLRTEQSSPLLFPYKKISLQRASDLGQSEPASKRSPMDKPITANNPIIYILENDGRKDQNRIVAGRSDIEEGELVTEPAHTDAVPTYKLEYDDPVVYGEFSAENTRSKRDIPSIHIDSIPEKSDDNLAVNNSEKKVTCVCSLFTIQSLGGYQIPLVVHGVGKIQSPLDEDGFCVKICSDISSKVSVVVPIWNVSWKMTANRLNPEDTINQDSVLLVNMSGDLVSTD